MICEKPNNTETIDINNLHQPKPLSRRVVRGGIWVFALRITNRGLGFIRTIILARLLAPHDFGLFGIAMLAIATIARQNDFYIVHIMNACSFQR